MILTAFVLLPLMILLTIFYAAQLAFMDPAAVGESWIVAVWLSVTFHLSSDLKIILAPASLLGFLLFAVVIKLLVVGPALRWSDLRWFVPAALFSACPVYLGFPQAFFLHKLLWFWSFAGIVFFALRRNSRLSAPSLHGGLAS